jgi:hypothetical protein
MCKSQLVSEGRIERGYGIIIYEIPDRELNSWKVWN